MKRILSPLLFAATFALPTAAHTAPVTWEVDPNHTTSGFSVTHMMLNTVRGAFGKTTGTVIIDDEDVTKSKIDVTIDAATVDTRVADRDKDLRSENFFWVDKYPTLTFKSTKFEAAGKGKLKVTGDLTIRGVTKSITLDVTGPSAAAKSPWGNMVRTASATGSINRKDFGLVWNKALEAGGVLVSDKVNLEIDAELVPPKPPAKAELEPATKAAPVKSADAKK